MVEMLCCGFAVDEDVVEEDDDEVVQKGSEDVVHEGHEGSWCVGEAKR